MASSTVKPMPATIEAYKELAQRDLELIMEMKAIIRKQNAELNKLRQRRTGSNNEYIPASQSDPF